jgi:hypothetical protein
VSFELGGAFIGGGGGGGAGTGDIDGVTAGNGLTGGGASGTVTLDVGAGTGITVAADSIAVDQTFAPTWTGAHIFTNSAGTMLQYEDGSAAVQTDVLTVKKTTTTTATAGIGSNVLFQIESGAGTTRNAARLGARLSTVTDGAEVGLMTFEAMTAGAAPTAKAWVNGSGFYSAASLFFGALTAATGAVTTVGSISVVSPFYSLDCGASTIGGFRFTGTANTTGARNYFTISPSSNTGQTATTETSQFIFNTHTNTWANGTIALQREVVWNQPTYAQTSSTNVITSCVMHDMGGIPTSSGATVAFTQATALRIGASATQGATVAGTTYQVIDVPAHTITYTGSTQVTSTVGSSTVRLGIVTLTDASAVTIDAAATLDIVGAPAAAGSVTLTSPYALLVRAGDVRLNGTNFGLYGHAPAAQDTGGQDVTNSVTDSGSTAGTIPDITDGNIYSNDYTNLRRALFQLARLVKQDHDWLRSIGALT